MTARRKTALNKSYVRSGGGGAVKRGKATATTTRPDMNNRAGQLDAGLGSTSIAAKAPASHSEVMTLISPIIKMVRRNLGASASSILMLDEENNEFTIQFADGPTGESLQQVRLGTQSGIAAWVASHGEPVIVIDRMTGFSTHSVMCVPLIVRERVAGAIEVLNRLDGRGFTDDDLEHLTAVATIAATVLEGKEAEEELRESEKRLREYLECIPDAIYISDPEGNFIYGNRAAETMTGYSREEMVGKNFLEVGLLPESYLAKASQVRDVNAAGEPTGAAEVGLIRKDGDTVFAEISTHPIGEGKNVEVIGIARDVTERRQAQKRLKQNEMLFQALVESSFDAVAIINADGTIRYESPSVEQVLGYSPEELVGRAITEFLHPDDLQSVVEALGAVVDDADQPEAMEIRFLHKDGSWRICEGTGRNLIDDPAVNGIVVNYRDISERKRMEAEMRQSEERFRNVLDNSLDMVYRLDLGTGQYDYVSPASERVLGYSPEEFTTLGLESAALLIHPDDMEMLANEIIELVAQPNEGKTASTVVYRIRHKEHGYRWVCDSRSAVYDKGNAPVAIVGTLRDVTEQREAEADLRESELRFRDVMENSFDMVYRMDLASGNYDYVSPASRQLLGYDPDEFKALGSGHMVSLIHPDDIDSLSEGIVELMTPQSPERRASTIEYRIRHRDSGYRWVADNISVINDEVNLPVAVVGNVRDITQRKLAEEDLRIKENALEHSLNAIAMSDMDGIITYVNQACVRMNECTDKEELVGLPYWQLLSTNEVVVAEEVAKAMSDGQSWEGVVIAKDKIGAEKHVHVSSGIVKDAQGNPIQTISSLIDVTEQKRAEQALRDSEERYRLIAEKVTDVIWSMGVDLRYTYVSPSITRQRGYSVEEAKAQTMEEMLTPASLDTATKLFAEAFVQVADGERSPSDPLAVELEMNCKDGSTVWVETTASFLPGPDGSPTGMVGISRDITGRKAAEEALRESEDTFRRLVEDMSDGYCVLQGRCSATRTKRCWTSPFRSFCPPIQSASSPGYGP